MVNESNSFEVNEDLRLSLLAGDPIILNDNSGEICKVHALKLEEIKNMGLTMYYYYLSVLCNEPDDWQGHDNLFEYTLSMCLKNKNYAYLVLSAIVCFTKESVYLGANGFILDTKSDEKSGKVSDSSVGNKERVINKSNFENFIKLIKLQNCMSIEKEYKPANKKAQEIINRLNKSKKKKPKSKNNIDLASIISGVVWRSSHTNIKNVWELSVYQLYDAFYRLGVIDDFNLVMTGYYTGNIEKKDIDFKNLNWVKKIEPHK